MGIDKPGKYTEKYEDSSAKLKYLESLDKLEAKELQAKLDKEPAPLEIRYAVGRYIGGRFAGDGFKYLKSKCSVIRRTKEYTFEFYLWTSKYNVRGLSVTIRPSLHVYQSRLEEWRGQQPLPSRKDGFVAGGPLGHTLSVAQRQEFGRSDEWNFAGSSNYCDKLEDLENSLRAYALPYCEQFLQPESVIEKLLCPPQLPNDVVGVPSMWLADAVEFTLCFGSKRQAALLIQRVLDARPEFGPKVESELEVTHRKNASLQPYALGNYIYQIVWLKLNYDL